ncbi:MAG: M4 family metallopeptidase [Candidatus Binatia bacterium]
MSSTFKDIRFTASEQTPDVMAATTSRGMVAGAAAPAQPANAATAAPDARFQNDEAAARFYASRVFERDARPGVRSLTAPESPAVVPGLRVARVKDDGLSRTRFVQFEQTQSAVPIFGSNVIVEMHDDRSLVGVNGQVADAPNVSPIATITPERGLAAIAALTNTAVASLQDNAPTLTYYQDEATSAWHLAWFYRKVPAVPPDLATPVAGRKSHGLGRSPRDFAPRADYLVDAHDGAVLFYYSSTPTLVQCFGVDELNVSQKFFGEKTTANSFELHDTLRALKTFDLGFSDIGNPQLPQHPVTDASGNWHATNTAAVSAHVNAMRVSDFYRSVLQRDSIDDKGMEIVSVVNCIYQSDEPGPEWHNAAWYDNRMWYGQIQNGNSRFTSFSRYLDVIAHELTHGVTEPTADLVYQNESGALNESFSDIFGIMVANFATKPQQSVKQWDWELGSGLGGGGLPLRDLKDPTRTGDPDHWSKFVHTSADSGGVHTNSNIHNKAAFNVLTAEDPQGLVFTPEDVAILYYLTLQRLGKLAKFVDVRRTLIDVAHIYYAALSTGDRQRKVDAIGSAYTRVGIV